MRTFIDRPDLPEAFADSIGRTTYDGQTLRIEFCVTRFDRTEFDPSTDGTQFPTARVVLSQAGIAELFKDLDGLRQLLAEVSQAQASSRAASH